MHGRSPRAARILGGSGSDGGQWLIVTTHPDFSSPRIAILGGGPGGYEAAMVAASLGAQVTIIERAGLGGSAVLTDVVPSKTLIATADLMTRVGEAGELGVKFDVDGGDCTPAMRADLKHINDRLLGSPAQQSEDIQAGLEHQNVRILIGSGRLLDNHTIEVLTADGTETVEADAILLAVGAHPRELPTARPDGERILNWAQIYNLDELPEELIVVGSGVTGAEFASAYNGLGSKVTLISSRDRVLPGSDTDAAEVLEGVFERRGVHGPVPLPRRDRRAHRATASWSPSATARRSTGSHCLVCVGLHPQHCRNRPGGGRRGAHRERPHQGRRRLAHHCAEHLRRRRLHRRSALASVAAMQGRIAIAHFLGDSVTPAQAAPGGVQHLHLARDRLRGRLRGRDRCPASTRATSSSSRCAATPAPRCATTKDGFVKIFARKGSGTVIGGVVVGAERVRTDLRDLHRGDAETARRRRRQHLHGVPVTERLHLRSSPAPARAHVSGAPRIL